MTGGHQGQLVPSFLYSSHITPSRLYWFLLVSPQSDIKPVVSVAHLRGFRPGSSGLEFQPLLLPTCVVMAPSCGQSWYYAFREFRELSFLFSEEKLREISDHIQNQSSSESHCCLSNKHVTPDRCYQARVRLFHCKV